MKSERPININPLNYRFPIPAIVSILHRISGVVLFLLLPVLLWVLDMSLRSSDGFAEALSYVSSPLCKFTIWIFMSAMAYHLIAGIRHLLMDIGIGETKQGGKLSSYIVLVLSVLSIVLLGVWLW